MLPIRDANPSISTPVVTFALIAISVLTWVFIQPKDIEGDAEFSYRNAAIACEIVTGEPVTLDEVRSGVCDDGSSPGGGFFPDKQIPLSVVVSMFLHAGLLHLGGNMWSLWIFGNNVEDAFGHVGYVVLYLLSGVAATLGFVAFNADTTIPLVGASGAIAGVMGAYLVLFPKAKVVSVFPILFFIPITLRATIFLAIWFVSQFALVGGESGVAWEAHVAGFAFGALAALVMRRRLLDRLEAKRHARLIGYRPPAPY